jgi:peptidoglycan/xylan/chitin deacetylase (PgdA/CDA1 family)
VRSVGGHPRLAWAEGLDVTLPNAALDGLQADRSRLASGELVLAATQAEPALAEHARALRLLRAFTDSPPASARLPFSYQLVPGRVRAVIASAIGRWYRTRVDRWGRFPRWPLDLSADFLADAAGVGAPATISGRAAVMLTHDIDSAEGLENLVRAFLPLEEAAGAHSTNFIVPCAWPLDDGLVREVAARGHHVGVHGYDHSNRTPFADDRERQRRLDGARPFAERYGVLGYRAPSLLRTRALLRDLSSRYRYDSSMPSAGGLFPVPNSGCATARPFEVEGILEIPISLPRDGSLRFLGFSPSEIADMWIDCARRIARSGGVVMLLTHCERRFSGTPPMLDAYRRFLDFIRSEPSTFAWQMPAGVSRQSSVVSCQSGINAD